MSSSELLDDEANEENEVFGLVGAVDVMLFAVGAASLTMRLFVFVLMEVVVLALLSVAVITLVVDLFELVLVVLFVFINSNAVI